MVTVTALATGQFVIELLDAPQNQDLENYLKVPLFNGEDQSAASRNSSRSRLDGILIHPNDSTVSHADAVVMEMGFRSDTKMVEGRSYPSDQQPWEAGKGKDAVRGTSGRRHSQQQFSVGGADNDDSD